MVFPGKVADRPPTNEGNRPLLSHRKNLRQLRKFRRHLEKKVALARSPMRHTSEHLGVWPVEHGSFGGRLGDFSGKFG
jgi:hypothetical protein